MSGKFYSRRGFIGLTAGLGLSACTGAAPSTSGTGSSAPTSPGILIAVVRS